MGFLKRRFCKFIRSNVSRHQKVVTTVVYRSFLAYIEEYSSINEDSLKVIKKGEYVPNPKPNSFYIGKKALFYPLDPEIKQRGVKEDDPEYAHIHDLLPNKVLEAYYSKPERQEELHCCVHKFVYRLHKIIVQLR